MGSREEILNMLRDGAATFTAPPVDPIQGRDVFADYPDANTDLAQRFSAQVTALKAECYLVGDIIEAGDKILSLIEDGGYQGIVRHDHEEITRLLGRHEKLMKKLGPRMPTSLEEMPNEILAQNQVGITGAEALIARTGSILVRTTTCGGRRLSILPEFHIVVARRSSIVPSLEQALAGIPKGEKWSYGAIITGPSRTADIEKVLVLGAHGPKRLAVVIF